MIRKRTSRSSIVLMAAVLGLVTTALTACSAGGSEPLKVAVFGPMTGAYASTGLYIWNGAQLAADDINAAGGVAGRKIELVQTDDECDPGKGANVAQKVADDAAILAAVGWLCSSVAIPSSDIFAPTSLGMISVGATNPKLTDRGLTNAFRVVAHDGFQAPAAYLFLKKTLSPKSLALIDESTEATVAMNDAIEKLAKADGVAINRYAIRVQDKDFRAILGTVPKDVDAMVLNIGPGPAALIAQQSKELGLDVPLMGNDSSYDPENYVKAAGGAAEGNWVTSGAPDPAKIEGGKDFASKYKSKFGDDPASYAPVAYVAIQAIADAIGRAETIDRASITRALGETNDCPTILGPLSFNEHGDPTAPQMYVYQVKGESFEMVDTIAVEVDLFE